MGREATRREMSYLDAGIEAFYMAQELDTSLDLEGAVRAAIDCAVNTAQRGITRGTRDDILEKAEDLDDNEESDLFEDGPAALLWYAKLLDDMLPPEQRLDTQ